MENSKLKGRTITDQDIPCALDDENWEQGAENRRAYSRYISVTGSVPAVYRRVVWEEYRRHNF